MELLSIASAATGHAVQLAADSEPLFQINLFQVIVAAANFVVFLVLMYTFAFKPISAMLAARKERIEPGRRLPGFLCNSKACKPAPRAPSQSISRLSPMWSVSSRFVFSREQAFAKMIGDGL